MKLAQRLLLEFIKKLPSLYVYLLDHHATTKLRITCGLSVPAYSGQSQLPSLYGGRNLRNLLAMVTNGILRFTPSLPSWDCF